MGCRKFHKLMLLYREGELSGSETERLAGHLAACASCAAWGESLVEMAALMQRLRAMPLAPSDPAGLTRRILSRIPSTARAESHPDVTRMPDRLFAFAATPGFRLAASGFVVAITTLFLWQYFSVLGDMRRLEARQTHLVAARPSPEVEYIVDARPLQGTPGEALFARLGGDPREENFVIMDHTLDSWREREAHARLFLLKNRVSDADTEALSRLVGSMQSTARPAFCFYIEGA